MRLLRLLPAAFLITGCTAAPGTPANQVWTWPVARPADLGFDSSMLASFDAEIADGVYGNIDHMLVIRRGTIAYEQHYDHDYREIYGDHVEEPSPLNAHHPSGSYNYFNAWWHPYYRDTDLHSLQSVTKTIASAVIGTAVTRGDFPSIETPVLEFFEDSQVRNVDDRKRRMTIRHLLTMTAGIDWNENLPYTNPANTAVQLEASSDWVDFTINRPMAEEPGTRFNYSSGVSAVLAQVFYVATGTDIEEYAARHLFAPLGITDWYWKRSGTGLIDTEGGLYLGARDVARIWQMFLDRGVWQGERIVTEDWVTESVTPAIPVDNRGTGVMYGLKWWLVPYGSDSTRLAWAGSGFGGQIPVAIPEHELVVVFNGWNILGPPALGRQVALEKIIGALVE